VNCTGVTVAGSGCAEIPGATNDVYTPTDADIGRRLALREIATENDACARASPRQR
jgi:hypothetical protein